MAKRKSEVTTLSSRGQIVLPTNIRQKLGLKRGDKFLVYDYNKMIVLKPIHFSDIKSKLSSILKKFK